MVPPSHATATSSPRLYLRMQLHPARRACNCNQLAAPASAPAHPLARSPAAPAAHRPPHGAHLAPAALHALRSTLRWFRLVRGTNFSKIQFIYISNSKFGMTQPSYWLRCEKLFCGPRFDSGTGRVIVVGPQRRPSCNNNFTTTDK
jgi:hypothetical protein